MNSIPFLFPVVLYYISVVVVVVAAVAVVAVVVVVVVVVVVNGKIWNNKDKSQSAMIEVIYYSTPYS